MTLILTRQDVEKVLSMELTLEAVEEAFRDHGHGRTQIPDRPVLVLEEYHGIIGVMPAYMERLCAAGVKLISHHDDNARRGLPEGMGLIVYHDPTTGMPLAIMDCAYTTLYALDTLLELPSGAARKAVLEAMEGHVLAQAELLGYFTGQQGGGRVCRGRPVSGRD